MLGTLNHHRTLLYLALFALLALSLAPLAEAQTLNWSLAAGDSEEDEDTGDVDEWNGDVINVTSTGPGVLHLEGEGLDYEGSSGSEDVCGGGSRTLSGDWLSQADGRSSIPLRPGTYTLELHPHGTVTYEYRLRAKMLGPCSGVSGDDHGDIPLCATGLCLSTPESGDIGNYTKPDTDMFTFVLSSSDTVTVESTGSTDVEATLLDEDGHRLAYDDDSGNATNFRIDETLGAGRYFVRVRGVNSATGSYSVSVE